MKSAPNPSQPARKQNYEREREITFLCSLALLGLSGVWLELAGAPAMGDAVGFSMVSAGILALSRV